MTDASRQLRPWFRSKAFDPETNTKKCFRCEIRKPASDFYRDKNKSDGLHQFCKRCFNQYTEERRRLPDRKKRRREYERELRQTPKAKERQKRNARSTSERHPEQSHARSEVRKAISKGEIVVPNGCKNCGAIPGVKRNGARRLQGHHDDYSKPLSVRWLCEPCHVAHHLGSRNHD